MGFGSSLRVNQNVFGERRDLEKMQRNIREDWYHAYTPTLVQKRVHARTYSRAHLCGDMCVRICTLTAGKNDTLGYC